MMQYYSRLEVFRECYGASRLVLLLVFAFAAPIWVTVALFFLMLCFDGNAGM